MSIRSRFDGFISKLILCLVFTLILVLIHSNLVQAAPVSQEVISGPDWLLYVNQWRSKAGMPPVVDSLSLSVGSSFHSAYVAETGDITYVEDQESEWYTQAGAQAGYQSNMAASPLPATAKWAIDFWVSSPFYLIPMLDPKLESVGFGLYQNTVEEEDEGFSTVATLDVRRGRLEDVPEGITYPVLFPADGEETYIVRQSQVDYPDPLSSCPDFERPTGPPIVALFGSGDTPVTIEGHRFSIDGETLEYCIFDESSYFNELDPFAEELGRLILGARNAVVIIPRQPLEVDSTYTVDLITSNGVTSWSFTAISAFQTQGNAQ